MLDFDAQWTAWGWQNFAHASLLVFRAHPDHVVYSVVRDCMQGLEDLKTLIKRLEETLRHRVKANIIAISKANFIKLPPGQALSCEELIADQAGHLSKEMEFMANR